MGFDSQRIKGTVVWLAPFYNRTGFGTDARSVVLPLARDGMKIKTVPVNNIESGIDDVDMDLLKQLENTPVTSPITYIVSHVADKSWLRVNIPEPNLKILATTTIADTNVPPESMLDACRAFDQIWVMTERERQILVSHGISGWKVQVVCWPHIWINNPKVPPAKPAPSLENNPFRFLTIALFSPRRRWDTMIEAFLEEFKGGENVELYLKVNYPSWHPVPGKPRQDLLDLIQKMRLKTGSSANIIIDEDLGNRSDIVKLIDSCHIYVSTDTAPTSPLSEAFGRKRAAIFPYSFNYHLDGDNICIESNDDIKIPLSEEMLLYLPLNKESFLPLLDVKEVRRCFRKAYNMTPDERIQMSDKYFKCMPTPESTIPTIINNILGGWEYKRSLMESTKSDVPEGAPTSKESTPAIKPDAKKNEKSTASDTGMNKLRFEGNIKNGFSNHSAFGKLPPVLPSPLKLNLGCGNDVREGYLNIDLFSDDPRVIAMDIRKLLFPDNSVDSILASDVLEHFSFREVDVVLKEWARVLKPNGEIIIRSPSLKLQAKAYLSGKWNADVASYMIFGGQTNPGDYHHVGFDRDSIKNHLALAGFELKFYEEIDVPQDKGFCNLNFAAKAVKVPLKMGKNTNGNPVNIAWEGSQFVYHSLALINREMSLRLLNDGFNISVVPFEKDQFTPGEKSPLRKLKEVTNKKLENTDIVVRHQWPPNLNPPVEARWVVIQPWEFGSLPQKWADVFASQVDEMWVPSNYVRDVYISSGVPAERVFVIPNGFDPEKFNPQNKPYKLKTKKKFKFLFVGGTIYRKGIDILVEAYLNTFKKSDDVCLVIKDMGGDSFYQGQTFKTKIAELKNQKDAPEIEYIDKTLNDKELAGLYTACNALVHPYRGEGFGLPILEAMASGIPAIVTSGGACLDFCSESNSLPLRAEKIYFDENKVGDLKTVSRPWLYEVKREDLVEKMLFAVNNPEAVKELGKKAAMDALSSFTWDMAFLKMKERIEALKNMPVRRFLEAENKPGIESLFAKIHSAFEQKDYEEALRVACAIEGLISNPEAEENRKTVSDINCIKGLCYFQMSDLESAQASFEKALNLNPVSSEACRGLGEVFFAAEVYEVSKTMFEWAVKNNPENKTALLGLARVNAKLGFPEAHNSLFDNPAGNAENTHEGGESGETYNGEEPEFKSYFKEAFRLYQNKEFKDSLLKLYEAENHFDSNTSDEISLVDLNVLRGTIYIHLEDLNNSRISFEKALNLDPSSSAACSGLGEIFFRSGLVQESKTMYEWAVKNDPGSSFANNGLVKVNKALGHPELHNSLTSE